MQHQPYAADTGKEMVDYIADYLENIRDRRVYPSVKPGYMRNLVPDSAPLAGEEWTEIFKDVERVIMPGMTHWQSPHMHAYFPALNSFPSLLGDMLADAINCLGFTWVRCVVFGICRVVRLYCVHHTKPNAGFVARLYRAGDHRDELAGQDDWPARGVSALE